MNGEKYELFSVDPVTASDENGTVGFEKDVTLSKYLTPADTETDNYALKLKIGEDEIDLTPASIRFYKYDVLLGFLPVTDITKVTAESIEGETADYFFVKDDPEVIAIVIK